MNKRTFCLLAAAAVMTACAATPGQRPAATPAEPASLTKVYFYPLQGQTEDQQDRDRYECHYWSVRQTGFDPSLHLAPSAGRAAVVPARSPGQAIGAAAVVGALLGAVASGPGDSAKGALVGAMAGTVLGSAAASAEAGQARQIEQRQNASVTGRYSRQAAGFRRAMTACLEGRGYSVK